MRRQPKNRPDFAVGDIFRGEYVARYEAKRAAKAPWGLEHQALVKLLHQLPRGIRVLDVPFGTGRFVEEYLARNMSVAGIDISADMLAEARIIRGELLSQCALQVGPSVPLIYDDDSFDLVVSFRFLSGIVDADTALASMREFARVAPQAILQLKCRPEEMAPPIEGERTNKLSKNFYRRDMDSLFEKTGWKIRKALQIDHDPTGNRWAFLCIRG